MTVAKLSASSGARALELAKLGFHVFPVALKDGKKKPLTEMGEFSNSRWSASNDIACVYQAFKKWPSAAIGIATGESDLVVIDVDPDKGGDAWLDEHRSRMRVGYEVRTPRGGRHLYYRAREGSQIKNSASMIAPGVDVRGEGGYVVAYDDAESGSLKEIREIPLWLHSAAGKHKASTRRVDFSGETAREGQRSDRLIKFGGRLVALGKKWPIVETAVMNEADRCRPPFGSLPGEEDELEHTVLKSLRGYWEEAQEEIEENGAPTPIRKSLDWTKLEGQKPPKREWVIEDWIGMGHVTMLAGAGGTGKTNVAQAMGSCISLGDDYLDRTVKPRTVLMWAAEDDHNELWRRQVAIARWMKVPLKEYADKFYLHSYDGELIDLVASVDRDSLVPTSMYDELCSQISDYGAEVVILDNVARLYAGNENDRHQVTTFIALLTAAARATNAAIILLSHPGKAEGSEYSGTTAWDGAVRSRLFLSRELPGQEKEKGGYDPIDNPEEDGVRYLARRKVNYSARDFRKLQYLEGVMVPVVESPEANRLSPKYAENVVIRAVKKLADLQAWGNLSTSSPSYLPKLAKQYRLMEHTNDRTFKNAMYTLHKKGRLAVKRVGQYTNRAPKKGLVLR